MNCGVAADSIHIAWTVVLLQTHLLQGAVQLDEEEEKNVVQHLQEELIAVRLREAETIIHIKDLNNKISELQDVSTLVCEQFCR